MHHDDAVVVVEGMFTLQEGLNLQIFKPRNRYEHRAVAAPFPPSHTVQRMRQHPVFGVTESVARLSDRFFTTPMHGVHSKTNKTNEHSKRAGEKTVAAKQARRACLCHTRAT